MTLSEEQKEEFLLMHRVHVALMDRYTALKAEFDALDASWRKWTPRGALRRARLLDQMSDLLLQASAPLRRMADLSLLAGPGEQFNDPEGEVT